MSSVTVHVLLSNYL